VAFGRQSSYYQFVQPHSSEFRLYLCDVTLEKESDTKRQHGCTFLDSLSSLLACLWLVLKSHFMDDHGHYDEIISRTLTRSLIENVSFSLLSYFDFYFSYLFETNSQHELFSRREVIKCKLKLIPNGSDITFGRLPSSYAQTPIHLPSV
jgi:hypothetical protein